VITRRSVTALLCFAVVSGYLAPPAFAHLTGVFAYFVQDINEPTATTRLLRQQLSSSADRIAQLQPEIEAARNAYAAQAESVVRRMRFYDVYAGNAVGALWTGAQDPIDVLASMQLMQKRLDEDLQALVSLEQAYASIQLKEQTLTRYQDLLRAFETSAEARDARLASIPQNLVSPFGEPYAAYEIAEAWEAFRPTTFISYFEWAARRIAEGLDKVLAPADASGGSWEIREDVLNALIGGDTFPFVEDAQIYLRADHINFSAQLQNGKGTYHLLTIGQLERTGPASVQYRIEGIFLDGMPIDPNDPDVQREVYQGKLLPIDLTSVLPKGSRGASFSQHNGYLSFRRL
jgi:hypothetical protein